MNKIDQLSVLLIVFLLFATVLFAIGGSIIMATYTLMLTVLWFYLDIVTLSKGLNT